MESMQYQGWIFNFDKDATREYYAKHRYECSGAPCRNFHQNLFEMPSEVRRFLEGFGVDIDNPIEQMSTTAFKEDNLVEQEVMYCVKGTASSEEGYEIDIGNVQISIVKDRSVMPNHEMPEPYFGLILYNLFFHWTVDDDIDDWYPESNKLLRKNKTFLFRKK